MKSQWHLKDMLLSAFIVRDIVLVKLFEEHRNIYNIVQKLVVLNDLPLGCSSNNWFHMELVRVFLKL